jgi:xyloglucan-specific exo-beta-1,4-glucanase
LTLRITATAIGRFRVIAGDPRVFGRVYVGTDGRGVFYGEPAP